MHQYEIDRICLKWLESGEKDNEKIYPMLKAIPRYTAHHAVNLFIRIKLPEITAQQG
jgi:hypothetical protein